MTPATPCSYRRAVFISFGSHNESSSPRDTEMMMFLEREMGFGL